MTSCINQNKSSGHRRLVSTISTPNIKTMMRYVVPGDDLTVLTITSRRIWKRQDTSRWPCDDDPLVPQDTVIVLSQSRTWTRQSWTDETMELPDLGVHCAVTTCNQLDFLPVKCDACKSRYCNDHWTYDAHTCPQKHTRNVQVSRHMQLLFISTSLDLYFVLPKAFLKLL